MMTALSVFLLLVLAGTSVQGARILGLLPIFGKSHHRMFQPLMRALVEAGHEVVVYSPFPLHNPPSNYTDVFLENIKTESEQPHPNCVLFITHGGLLSQHEAVHFGVPVVGIPQFFDQHRNVKYYEDQGVGLKIETSNLSEKTILAAIREILDNPRYRENMKRLSAIFKDRPLSPAETVVFWTEYVLRHGGAAHLRPASTELHWYQLTLLDGLILLLAIILLIIITLYWIIKCGLIFVFKSDRKPISTSKKYS